MKVTGYLILNSRSKLTYAQFDPMQYQMSNSEEIKYATRLNSYTDYRIINMRNQTQNILKF